jgi:hypothetical protein
MRRTILTMLAALAALSPSTAADAAVPRIGDSVTLHGFDGLKMKVTVMSIDTEVFETQPCEEFQKFGDIDIDFDIDRLRETCENVTAPYIGVTVALRNVGRRTYSDAPSNGADLRLKNGKRAKNTILVDGECDSSWASSTTIRPGRKQIGCIPFEKPDQGSATPTRFDFTLNSGFADETGHWHLTKRKKRR